MSTCWPSQSFSEASPSTFYLHFIYQTVSSCPHISSKEPGISGFFQSQHVVTHKKIVVLSSIQFSRSVVSDSLWSHGLQNSRLPCPSTIPNTWSNWCPLSRWCHPTISSSVIPFSFHLQSCPASGSFPMNQFFTSGGQSIGDSVSASNFQWIFRTDFLQDSLLWSPCCPRDSRESSPTLQFKSISFSALSFLHSPMIIHIDNYHKCKRIKCTNHKT